MTTVGIPVISPEHPISKQRQKDKSYKTDDDDEEYDYLYPITTVHRGGDGSDELESDLIKEKDFEKKDDENDDENLNTTLIKDNKTTKQPQPISPSMSPTYKPIQRKKYTLKRTKSKTSKEKSVCEYYNEEDDLEDGDLPSLYIPVSSSTTNSMLSVSGSNDVSGTVTSSHSNSIPVLSGSGSVSMGLDELTATQSNTSSPTLSRSTTPVVENTNTNHNSTNSTNNNNSTNTTKPDNNKTTHKNKKKLKEEKEEIITLTGPKLSTNDKRKHRAFWDQFEGSTHSSEIDDDSNHINTNNTNQKNKKDEYDNIPHDERRTVSPIEKDIYESEDEKMVIIIYTL